MRVSKPSGPFPWRANLNIIKSEDDGKWWNGLNAPHSGDGLADYPQLISSGKNLYLVYSHIHEFPIQTNASFTFKKSENEGSRWSSAIVLDAPNLSAIGPDITVWGQNKILATCGNRNSNYLYCFESSDEGNNWHFLDSLLQPTGENACITKPIARKEFDHFAILSHKAHIEDTPISLHVVNGTQKQSKYISNGAYAQGWMDESGDIHLTYNKRDGDDFKIQYFKVMDLGQTYSEEITLYSGTYEESKLGEYQSFYLGNDGNFHLIFCDWSDGSKAKHLVFSPDISEVQETEVTSFQIFPNPVKHHLQISPLDENRPYKISILDAHGKVLKRVSYDSNVDSLPIKVSDLTQGTYFLLLETAQTIRVTKFLKS
ncbi:MAG: T9SS type A sorting domain-containing protein [Saprospiraceae bacterium]